jgi:hypothetical protein
MFHDFTLVLTMAQITAAAQIFKCKAKNYGVPFSNRQSLGFPNHVTEKKWSGRRLKRPATRKSNDAPFSWGSLMTFPKSLSLTSIYLYVNLQVGHFKNSKLWPNAIPHAHSLDPLKRIPEAGGNETRLLKDVILKQLGLLRYCILWIGDQQVCTV